MLYQICLILSIVDIHFYCLYNLFGSDFMSMKKFVKIFFDSFLFKVSYSGLDNLY